MNGELRTSQRLFELEVNCGVGSNAVEAEKTKPACDCQLIRFF